jgi:hypothetical protein
MSSFLHKHAQKTPNTQLQHRREAKNKKRRCVPRSHGLAAEQEHTGEQKENQMTETRIEHPTSQTSNQQASQLNQTSQDMKWREKKKATYSSSNTEEAMSKGAEH